MVSAQFYFCEFRVILFLLIMPQDLLSLNSSSAMLSLKSNQKLKSENNCFFVFWGFFYDTTTVLQFKTLFRVRSSKTSVESAGGWGEEAVSSQNTDGFCHLILTISKTCVDWGVCLNTVSMYVQVSKWMWLQQRKLYLGVGGTSSGNEVAQASSRKEHWECLAGL